MLRILTWLIVSLFGCSVSLAAEVAQPNIIFLLADDLGTADVGWRGGKIKTPHLDQLANNGVRLESFYVQPVCSPTRAALMTGRYPMRHGLQVGVVRPWAQYGLPLEEKTLAQALQEAGYTTAIVGKWHLGHFQPEYLPTRRGFDRQYGHYNGALDYFTHIRDGGFDWHRNDQKCEDEGYATHLLAKEAVKVIQDTAGKKPFFLYVPFNAVHSPYQVPGKYTEAYANMEGQRKTYAGMLAAMDEAVGQIIAAVDQAGVRKNTLIVFSSDNGGPFPGKITDNGKYRAGKGTLYEGGVRVAAFTHWEGKIKAGSICDEPLHMVDWYPTLVQMTTGKIDSKLPLDGKNLWPTISAGKPSPHEEILLNITPNRGAIRAGQWKLIWNGHLGDGTDDEAKLPKKQDKEKLELFDLANDVSETKNLADTHPEKVKELRTKLEAYAKQAVAPKSKPKPKDFQSPKVWGESSAK